MTSIGCLLFIQCVFLVSGVYSVDIATIPFAKIIAIERNVDVTDQAQMICEKYGAMDSCLEIKDIVHHYESEMNEKNLDFVLVNMSLPVSKLLLPVEIDKQLHHIPLIPFKDPSLDIALFCRENKTLSMTDCDIIHQHAMALTKFKFNPSSANHYFRTLWPRQLCPISQRVYFEIDQAMDGLCFFLNTEVNPVHCGSLDADEPFFAKANMISTPGPHMLLMSRNSVFIHAVFFSMTEPKMQITTLQNNQKRLTMDGIDLYNTRNRICLLQQDTPFRCLNLESIVIEDYNPNHAILLLPPPSSKKITVLAINEYNKCICMSNEVSVINPSSAVDNFYSSKRFHPQAINNSSYLHDFFDQEWGFYSQNGEDGILQHLFGIIPSTTKYFVEFGAEDGMECNTRYLREKHEWNGILLDGSHSNASIHLYEEWITRDNILHLFHKHQVPFHFDLLSVDIDFNDYHILDAILSTYTPRVIIVEVNSHFRYPDARTVAYNDAGWDGITNYFGATIGAFIHLMSTKYTLVYCESHGVNCFFVLNELWTMPVEDPAFIDMPANFFGKGWKYSTSNSTQIEWLHLDNKD